MPSSVCVRCGKREVRAGRNAKYCIHCAPEAYREMNEAAKILWRKKKAQEKNRHKLCQWKPDTRGIGECPRWNECEYGADEEDIRFGSCKYYEKTGFCKVVVIDGKRTVEPTKNCRFFKPKETNEDV